MYCQSAQPEDCLSHHIQVGSTLRCEGSDENTLPNHEVSASTTFRVRPFQFHCVILKPPIDGEVEREVRGCTEFGVKPVLAGFSSVTNGVTTALLRQSIARTNEMWPVKATIF